MTELRVRANSGIGRAVAFVLCAALFLSAVAFAQQPGAHFISAHAAPTPRAYPKEIRGYKVELARVEVKKQGAKEGDAEADALIRLGEPKVVSLTPLGISLEVPVTVAAVKQGGQVDFLTFEDMTVNGTKVTVNEYHHPFELPNSHPVTLPEPAGIYVSTPRVLFGAIGEWSQPKDFWPVTGRVYVFGRFKKFLFTFKRVVPVELNLSFRNPLKSSRQ